MKFIGIVFIAAGILAFRLTKNLRRNESDYLKYPKTVGTVLHTHDFTGHRWIVKFKNDQGREVLGMDDVLAAESFHPEKYHMPKENTKQQIYYWELNRQTHHYSINRIPIEYNIHFCDERLYELAHKQLKRSAALGRLIGIGFAIAGIIMIAI